MYVPAGKYNPVNEYEYGNNLVSRSDYDEKYAWSGRFTGTEYYTTDILGGENKIEKKSSYCFLYLCFI